MKVWVLHFNERRSETGEWGTGWALVFSSREKALEYISEEWGNCDLEWAVSEYNPNYQEAQIDGEWCVLAIQSVDEDCPQHPLT